MNEGKELHERHCYRCGKGFIARQEWVFKTGKNHNEKLFCSWGCMRAWEKERGSKADRRERIIEEINKGKSTKEIARSLKEDKSHIIYWKNKMGVTT